MEQYKTCTKCGQAKTFSEFAKDKTKSTGLTSSCLACRRAYAKDKIANNPEYREVLRLQSKAYYHANKEASKARNKRWTKNNPQRRRDIDAIFRANNRAEQAERMKRYRLEHPEARKIWGQKNPDRQSAIRARRSFRLRGGDTFEIKIGELLKLYQSPCFYCGAETEHIDHIVPLARGGRHSIGNLTGACAPCNLSKGSKFITEWKKGKNG